MNTSNFQSKLESWEKIFKSQESIMKKYEPDLKYPVCIDTSEGQQIIRRFCWNILEEYVEFKDSAFNDKDEQHQREELTDMLNFVLELYVIVGKTPDFYCDTREYFKVNLDNDIIYCLGMFANTLKNREWRNTQHPVDRIQFNYWLSKIFPACLTQFRLLGLRDDDIRKEWSLKYQVNMFRLNSNY